jgi:hypothetical protein
MESLTIIENINTKKSQKDYYISFKKKHEQKIKEKVMCTICEGRYDYFNKSHHCKSKRHIFAVKMQNELTKLRSNIL